MYEAIRQKAHQLRLFGIHANLETRCDQSLAEGLHPSDLVRLLLEDECLQRKTATAKRLTTRAKFRSQCDLDNWDQGYDRGLSKAKFKSLAMLDFYHKKENLLIIGSTGVGKTHLAIALGRLLCHEQAAVSFSSVNLFYEQIQAEKTAGRYLNFIQKMKRVPVLMLDDFALRSYTHDEANTLLEILEERYGSGLTVITSQVDPKGWMTLYEDRIIGEAIVDRLLNPSQVIQLKGESYRKKRKAN